MALKQIDERVMIDLTKVLFMAFDAGKVKILFENDGIVELTDPDGKIWSVLTATKEPCFNCGGRGGWDVYAGMFTRTGCQDSRYAHSVTATS